MQLEQKSIANPKDCSAKEQLSVLYFAQARNTQNSTPQDSQAAIERALNMTKAALDCSTSLYSRVFIAFRLDALGETNGALAVYKEFLSLAQRREQEEAAMLGADVQIQRKLLEDQKQLRRKVAARVAELSRQTKEVISPQSKN